MPRAARAKNPYPEKIWLYLHFPLLPLDALLDEPKIEDDRQLPTAVVGQEKNAMPVLCCNDSAKKSGVEPLLSLSTALALCPELLTLQQQPEREKTTLQQLALIAYSFSPMVIIAEQGLWLEVNGKRIFRSRQRQLYWRGE